MRAVWSWLSELMELPNETTPSEAAAALTSGGLEVESLESVGDNFSGVVVAEVVSKAKHPDADKLTLVRVITEKDGEATEVVCGAGNVPDPGGRVLWARPGAVLPGDFKIGARELKGVVSAGMLCSEKELELGDDHDGIIVLEPAELSVALGSDAATSGVGGLGLRDTVFEIAIPANRSDALGHLGIARELAAILGGRAVGPADRLVEFTTTDLDTASMVSVDIEAPDGCPRYTARIIDGVKVGPSPRWMRRRLALVGLRPISNVVDVTNYVMFELGQPLHAFDSAKVSGRAIVVREAGEGESMTTLDGVDRTLEPGDLLICDSDGPIALAGVMGGAESEVSPATTRVILEAAQFAPKGVRRTSRRLDLRSEASYRFERHVDPNGVGFASARAASLLAEHSGGQVARGIVDVYPKPAMPTKVKLRPSRATAVTGVSIDATQATTYLTALGLGVESHDADSLTVTVPTSRPDVTREIDLIEEVLRMHGFESVPATLPPMSKAPHGKRDSRADRARDVLIGAGLSEAITYGFTSVSSIENLQFGASDPRSRPIALRNPMTASHAVMRTSLLATLLPAVARNLKHQESDVALFEIGSVFLGEVEGTDLPAEPMNVAAVIAGRRPGHLGDRAAFDLFDIKGIFDRLLAALDRDGELKVAAVASATIAHLHPGLGAELQLPSGSVIGELGEIHPSVRAAFEIEVPVFAFELGLGRLPVAKPAQMRPIPKYPAITRDLSFFIRSEIPAESVAGKLSATGDELLESVVLLEDFRDPAHVPSGQKGLLWSLTYRSHDKTLTDAEVDAGHEALCESVLLALSATRR